MGVYGAKFTKDTAITFIARVLGLILGIATSITIARILGPEKKGIYTMAALLPGLIVTLTNLGIGPATAYYVSKQYYPNREILGNNILLSFGIGIIGVFIGLIITLFFHQSMFPGVARNFLILALALIPVNIIFSYINYILLGNQRIKEFNLVYILQAIFFLIFILIALWIFKLGVFGAIAAGIISWGLVDVVLLFYIIKIEGGVSLKVNPPYFKDTITYGVQAHMANIIGFLNYRIDMFLVNRFLSTKSVGYYSIGVGLVEKLWLVSQAAATVIFPRVAAEKDEKRRKEFTPIVARTVLLITLLGAIIALLLSRWIVILFYSEAFLPSVRPLQALLPGIVALGGARILSNDIAGRGKPILNTYVGIISLIVNVILNIIWIPKYKITGAALASTVSYFVNFIMELFFYTRISGNSWHKVIFIQSGDWTLIWKAVRSIFSRIKRKA